MKWNRKMPKCTILIGLPASGKSTWLDQNYDNFSDCVQFLSTDGVIEDIAGRYDLFYDEVFKDLIGFAEKVMWREAILFAEGNYELYIDRTNLTIKSRAKFINMLKPYGYTFDAIVFETPEKEEWDRRLNSRRGKTIPAEILASMIGGYQAPLLSEGFEKITFIKNSD
jgi:predicted kinase